MPRGRCTSEALACYSTIKLANGENFSFMMGEDQAEKVFGEGTGQKVSVQYEVQQFWREEGGGFCARQEVFVSGKLLAAADTEFTQALKAANQGDANAQVRLGKMYLEGRGVAGNDVKAVEWFRKAAEQGNVAAQFYMGLMYANARGVGRLQVYRGAGG